MALGKIKADTLEHSTAGSLDTKFVVNGSAKAYARCVAAGTSITKSFNISSLADTGTALQTLTLTNAMSDANYAGVATSGDSSCNMAVDSHATTTYRLVSNNNAGSLTDSITQSGLLGDLA